MLGHTHNRLLYGHTSLPSAMRAETVDKQLVIDEPMEDREALTFRVTDLLTDQHVFAAFIDKRYPGRSAI